MFSSTPLLLFLFLSPSFLFADEQKSLTTRTSSVRIIGGDIVQDPNPYPWVTSLTFGCENGGGRALCAGSVIAPGVILTAAHCWDFDCIERGDRMEGVATVGLDNQNPDEALALKSWSGHPGYNPDNFENDIALWFLDGEFETIDEYARLPDDDVDVDTVVTAAGWGVTENGGTSQQLRDVELEIQPSEFCSAIFVYDEDTQICAGVDGGEEKDTCNGDSGGPLFIDRFVIYI